MERASRWLLPLAAASLLTACTYAQQTLPDGSGGPGASSDPVIPIHFATPGLLHSAAYRDLDLLRRNSFTEADQASVLVRVLDSSGVTPPNLQNSDFTLIVDGKPRAVHVHAPGNAQSIVPPTVLVVLPPNQALVHEIALQNAEKYFAAQPAELLPWTVGILDANGKMTEFTNGRSQLLADLDAVRHAKEPFQYAGRGGQSSSLRWDGKWMLQAEEAIGLMGRFEGPKVILAINPMAGDIFGQNNQMFAHNGPESLTAMALTIGAHIYIANVGGPETAVPYELRDEEAQINTLHGPVMGTMPSEHQRLDPRAGGGALDYYAFRTSMMMQTAHDTVGGFANTFDDLTAKIHHDLDGGNYSLSFDLSEEDTDKGVPSVEVRMARHDLRVAILDLEPLDPTPEVSGEIATRAMMDALRKAQQSPISSKDFRISQQVDYFPLRGGLEPLLPMSATIGWTGKGEPPRQVFVVESVEDPALSSLILERAIEAYWDGHSLSWERDGVLRPGDYTWRVVVHDGHGKVFASSEKKIAVGLPSKEPVEVSTLIMGVSCRDSRASTTGLQRRPLEGETHVDHAHRIIDPMHVADCRVKPQATAVFATADMLHAFVRIYPSAKFEKNRPESWTAQFVLRSSQSGSVEMEQEVPFTTDSGSGDLASIELPLSRAAISAGPHTLEVEMHGPGMRNILKASRSLSILAAP